MDLDTFFSAVLLISAVGFALGALMGIVAKVGGRTAGPATLVMILSLLVYLVGGAAGAAVRVRQEVRLGPPVSDASAAKPNRAETKPGATTPSGAADPAVKPATGPLATPTIVKPAEPSTPAEPAADPGKPAPSEPPAVAKPVEPAREPKSAPAPKKKKEKKEKKEPSSPSESDPAAEPAPAPAEAPSEPAEPAKPVVLEPKPEPKKPELLQDPPA